MEALRLGGERNIKCDECNMKCDERNIQCDESKRQGILAPTREVRNSTRRLGDGSRRSLCQKARGSVRAIWAIPNTRVFLTETRLVADARSRLHILLIVNAVNPFGSLHLGS